MHVDKSLSPKVNIILVNYNGWANTIECLESLFRLDYSNFQVICVDNESKDGSLDNIKLWAQGKLCSWTQPSHPLRKYVFPQIEKPRPFLEVSSSSQRDFIFEGDANLPRLVLIDAGCNLGFAAGNNIGIKFSQEFIGPDFFWLLNNDTVIPPRSLKELINFFQKLRAEDPKIGIVGSLLYYYHNPKLLQSAGGRIFKPLGLSSHVLEISNEDKKSIDFIPGASMFVSSNFIDQVGCMDESYFLYYEETDWAKRALDKGWSLKLCNDSIVFHKEGGIGHDRKNDHQFRSNLVDYYLIRNRLLFTKRHYPIYFPLVYLSLVLILIRRLKRGKWKMAKQVLSLMISPYG